MALRLGPCERLEMGLAHLRRGSCGEPSTTASLAEVRNGLWSQRLEETDVNLVKRTRNGDRQAFNELVTRYQRRLFGVCFAMVRNHDDAMDLVQESFVRAYRNLDRFEGNSTFYTWIYRIAKNVCIDHLRKVQRQRTVDYDDAVGRDEESDGSILPPRLDVNPAHILGRKELMEKIENAINDLSPKHREIILLREVEGMAYSEIAEVLSISIGTVMSRLFFARKNLQSALADYVGIARTVSDPE
jgi:RNA polymerase sigma-70 factor (ECF subfamily)